MNLIRIEHVERMGASPRWDEWEGTLDRFCSVSKDYGAKFVECRKTFLVQANSVTRQDTKLLLAIFGNRVGNQISIPKIVDGICVRCVLLRDRNNPTI